MKIIMKISINNEWNNVIIINGHQPMKWNNNENNENE